MNKQEERRIREIIDSLLPFKHIDEYLKSLEKAHNVRAMPRQIRYESGCGWEMRS